MKEKYYIKKETAEIGKKKEPRNSQSETAEIQNNTFTANQESNLPDSQSETVHKAAVMQSATDKQYTKSKSRSSVKHGKPRPFSALEIAYIGIFTAIITVFSWVSIPTTVPFTLQTFAVFAALGILGGKCGFFSVLVYILLGAIGIPVFSGFTGGLGHLAGTTGGYIVGFLLLAGAYWLITALFGEKLYIRIIAMTVGLLLCYAFGTAWFMYVYITKNGAVTLLTVLGWCVFPFIIPDAVKMALALLLSSKLRKYIKR